jgi:DNA-binding MarR family transcriptional regulator
LRRLARTVSRLYDRHLATTGLKTTQYSLLKSVAFQASPVAELAARLGTERTTLTRNLKPLLDAGWVALNPGADTRQRIATITRSGRDKIKAARQAWLAAQTELERELGTPAVHALHASIDIALDRLTQKGHSDDRAD